MTKEQEIIERNKAIYGIDFAAGMSKAFLIARDELAKEREKAKKLVEALKYAKHVLETNNCIYTAATIEQSLTEYENLEPATEQEYLDYLKQKKF